MKQTAVEWLLENLQVILTQSQFNDVVIQDVIKQAKEMEKRQMIDALDICQRTDFYVKYEGVEQYYNETFKKK